jgi:formylglycine-generating enzyme required for sulfatase activity
MRMAKIGIRKVSFLCIGILTAVALSAQAAPALPKAGPAYLIGNATYEKLPFLGYVQADMESIGSSLQARGFAIKSFKDLGREAMLRVIDAFAKESNGKEFALLYFSGYGRRFSGKDFMVPVDAPDYNDWILLEKEAISLDYVVSVFKENSVKNVLIVVDAGRSLPDGARDSAFSLNPGDGIWILYATQPGRYAYAEKKGSPHSPFAQSLLNVLYWDFLSMKNLEKLTRDDLKAITQHENGGIQFPELIGSAALSDATFLPPDPDAKRLPTEQEAAAARKTISVPMVYIPGGEFRMGNALGDSDGLFDAPAKLRRVSAFSIARYETSFDEFDAFCAASGRQAPSDSGWGRGKRPVIGVDWYDAIEYCNWLSLKDGLDPCYRIDKTTQDSGARDLYGLDSKRWSVACNWNASGYRLPSEAEWEYAAREGGKAVRFGNGRDVLDSLSANFNPAILISYSLPGTSRNKTLPVGSLVPNSYGLYDMAGNAWEWCWDWYDEFAYDSGDVRDPRGPAGGNGRVLRGGAWDSDASYVRAAFRGGTIGVYLSGSLGFRVARSALAPAQ